MRPDKLIRLVANYYGVEHWPIVGNGREAEVARMRHICAYLMRRELRMFYTAIADALNRSDHTTAMHSVEWVQDQMQADVELSIEIKHLSRLIQSRRYVPAEGYDPCAIGA